MIPQFALRLLLGMGLTWAILPRQQITSGFFRIQMLIALGLSVLAAVTYNSLSPTLTGLLGLIGASFWYVVCVVVAIAAYFGSVYWTLERKVDGLVTMIIIVVGTFFLVIEMGGRGVGNTQITTLIQKTLAELGASAILGSCVTAMLLGHWYLTTPTMSISPLSRANGWFAVTILLRAALAGWGYWSLTAAIANPTHGVWLALRWIAGIVLPALLCGMVVRILKYRNTQSATGVLFAAVILVFIGELAATLLSRELGVPL